MEKVACSLTFGKSKLITHDDLYIDATDRITQSVKENLSVSFTHYFTIKNISNKPIFCTAQLIAWDDVLALRNQGCYYEKILPGETYKIPAKMNMNQRHKFKSRGVIEVFAEDISETFQCEIISEFKPENK